jgi:DeoR/GlpR family transcriptional regulator of sugar metabolism
LKQHHLDLGIITNSPAILQEALNYHESKVISTGGELRQNFNMLAGKWVIEFLGRVNIDAAFISTAGVSSDWNITTSNAELAEILGTLFERTNEVNLLVDSSKFLKAAMLNVGHISQCHRVISDGKIDAGLLSGIEHIQDLELI